MLVLMGVVGGFSKVLRPLRGNFPRSSAATSSGGQLAHQRSASESEIVYVTGFGSSRATRRSILYIHAMPSRVM